MFFTSDNGYHLGEHKLPFGKGQPYDTDVRLPMYAFWLTFLFCSTPNCAYIHERAGSQSATLPSRLPYASCAHVCSCLLTFAVRIVC